MFVIIWMHSVPINLKFFYIYWNIIETYVWELMEKKLIKIQYRPEFFPGPIYNYSFQ